MNVSLDERKISVIQPSSDGVNIRRFDSAYGVEIKRKQHTLASVLFSISSVKFLRYYFHFYFHPAHMRPYYFICVCVFFSFFSVFFAITDSMSQQKIYICQSFIIFIISFFMLFLRTYINVVQFFFSTLGPYYRYTLAT